MPWTGIGFQKHNLGLTKSEASHGARIANAVLKNSGDEGMAIAVANKHFKKRAAGGALPRGGTSGFLHGATSGRSDAILTEAPAGSHVIPADVVSGLGEGNSLAGAKVLNRIFNTPYGVKAPSAGRKTMGPPRASGGGIGEGMPVALSDGEWVVEPDQVAVAGGGDLDRGHKVIDDFIINVREMVIDRMKKLPGPVKVRK
jgi:hypothetical protein